MNARDLYNAGKLTEAIQALSAEIRDNPTDNKRRTFLFELLCFNGDYDRARKHLELLAKENQQSGMGALLYEACMHAERTRHETFEKKDFPAVQAKPSRPGKINGRPFTTLEDADPRIGARLEVLTAGAYLWIPFEHIDSFELQAPKRLRDTLWSPVIIHTAETFQQQELGECLLPVIYPFSFKHEDGNVRLGRTTVWEQQDEDVIPYGQKTFLIDGEEEIGLLEIRTVEFEPAAEETPAEDAAVAG